MRSLWEIHVNIKTKTTGLGKIGHTDPNQKRAGVIILSHKVNSRVRNITKDRHYIMIKESASEKK